MEIRHILKDGTILSDITGHVVKMADAERAYTIMQKMSEEGRKKRNEPVSRMPL